jgi:hypothetical protein
MKQPDEINPQYAALADSSESDQEVPTIPMSDLTQALQNVHARLQRGTIADAWHPCGLLPFEGDISRRSDAELEQQAADAPQASSRDELVILNNLHDWRKKCITAVKTNDRVQIERYSHTVEAIRARARLIFLQKNGDNFKRRAHAQVGGLKRRGLGWRRWQGWWCGVCRVGWGVGWWGGGGWGG